MRCPACVQAEQLSRLNEHHRPKTEGTVDRFYDEYGIQHIHDRAVYETIWTCTSGHAYQQRFRSRCPCRGCLWNETPLVKAGQAPLGETPRMNAT
jgi:hypothetical protein